ncbi:MAG: outer membrane protein assembly factor BamB family protein, partial [Planctomycetota bacterium]
MKPGTLLKCLFALLLLCPFALGGEPDEKTPPAFPAVLKKLPLRPHWASSIPAADGLRKFFRVEDLLFAETESHILHALDRQTGKLRWVVALGSPLLFPPAGAEDRIYVTTDKGISALDRNTGKEKWKRTLPFKPGAPGVVAGDFLIFAASDVPRVFAFAVKEPLPKAPASPRGLPEMTPSWFF